jgi:hypothetical protein
MCHGGEIDHERCRAKIVDRGLFGLRPCGQHRFLKLGDGKLPIRLTEGDQSNPSGYQIGDVTLQEGGQSQAGRNTLPCRTNSQNDGKGSIDMVLAEGFRKPVQEAIGPYLA